MAAKDLAAKNLAPEDLAPRTWRQRTWRMVKLRNMVVCLPVIFILASIGSRSFPASIRSRHLGAPLTVQSVLTMS